MTKRIRCRDFKADAIREIKIEICTNTANGKPRLEVSGHAFEVCCTSRDKFAVNVAGQPCCLKLKKAGRDSQHHCNSRIAPLR